MPEEWTYEKALHMLANDAANLTWMLGQFDSQDPHTAGALVSLEQSNDLRMDEIVRLTRDVNGVMERVREHMTSFMRYGECDCIGECNECIERGCDCYAIHAHDGTGIRVHEIGDTK